MSIKRFYKIVKPISAKTDIGSSQSTDGVDLSYSNYSWYNRLVQGSNSRLQQYREIDIMDMDIDIHRALDMIAEEMTGNNAKTKMCFDLEITAGSEQRVPSKDVVTVKAALKTWIQLHRWDVKLFKLVRNVIKFGDVFFYRGTVKNKSWVFIPTKAVSGARVSEIDVTDVAGWIIKTDIKKSKNGNTSQTVNIGGFYGSVGNSNSLYESEFKEDEIIRFSLNNELSEDAPFGESVLKIIWKPFKQKQLLEEALVIYKISRAPERRVFTIDMGDTPPHERRQILEQFKNDMRQKKTPSNDGNGSAMDTSYNPHSINEDIFLASNGDKKMASVDTLPGGTVQSTDELKWFWGQIWRGLRIPDSYVGMMDGTAGTFNDGAVGIAYIQEIKFSEYIERLQKHIDTVMDKEFKRFLSDNGLNIDPTVFRISLPQPTNWSKSREQKINSDLVSVYSSIKDDPTLSKRFTQKKFLGLSEEEIIINQRQLKEEKGMNPDSNIQDLPKLYFPEEAEEQFGYDGSLGGRSSGGESSDGMDQSDSEEQDENDTTDNSDNQNLNTSEGTDNTESQVDQNIK